MDTPFYHNKLAGPDPDTGSYEQYYRPVAQSPQEQAILDYIQRMQQAEGVARTVSGGLAGLSLFPIGRGLQAMTHPGIRKGVVAAEMALMGAPPAGGSWLGAKAADNFRDRARAGEAELEDYATRDRR